MGSNPGYLLKSFLLYLVDVYIFFFNPRYITDVFNMLQGFYIFVIFICKRNVWIAMIKMKRGSPPALTRKKTAETRIESGNRNTWFPLKLSRT